MIARLSDARPDGAAATGAYARRTAGSDHLASVAWHRSWIYGSAGPHRRAIRRSRHRARLGRSVRPAGRVLTADLPGTFAWISALLVESELVAAVGKPLPPMGFRRNRFNWVRAGDALYSIVNVQTSAWDDGMCYLNLGFCPPDRVTDDRLPEHAVRCGSGSTRSIQPIHKTFRYPAKRPGLDGAAGVGIGRRHSYRPADRRPTR
jgi:hypothetical protein